jgi:hypothetical protein
MVIFWAYSDYRLLFSGTAASNSTNFSILSNYKITVPLAMTGLAVNYRQIPINLTAISFPDINPSMSMIDSSDNICTHKPVTDV